MEKAKKLIKNTLNTINTNMKPQTNCMQYTWSCSKCTFSANMNNQFKCEMCSAVREPIARAHSSNNLYPNIANTQLNANDTQQQKQQRQQNVNRTQMPEWTCSKCTLKNSYSNDVCEACAEPRNDIIIDDIVPVRLAAITDTTTTWSCKSCTYLNKIDKNECEICTTPSTNKVKNTPTIGQVSNDYWTCVMCSHKNTRNVELKCNLCSYQHNASKEQINRQQSRSIETSYECDETNAKKVFNNIIDYCKRQNMRFIDDSFPPCDKSLFINGRKPANVHVARWCTPNEIYVARDEQRMNWSVIYDRPSYNDIKQGLLGNCWFLSALAVISENENLLNRILLTKTHCPFGAYQIRLCMNGEWKVVIVDDMFPCDEHGRLVYSKSIKKQLWVILIEKAMAKLHGSYEALIAGHIIEGLTTLTGYPCETIRLDNEADFENNELLWAKLLSCREANFVFGASCGRRNLSDEEFNRKGLQRNHAYSILDVKNLANNRLVKLRNPWGSHVWNGDWSSGSAKWTPELRSQLIFKQSDSRSGIFWMSYDDFLKYFVAIDICKTRLNWSENRLSGQFISNTNIDTRTVTAFNFVCFETTQIDINIFLKNPKNRQDTTITDIDLSFIILKHVNNKLVYVTSSKREVKKCISHEHMFEKGEYVLVPLSFNFWSQYLNNCNYEYNLAMHSSTNIFLEQFMCSRSLISDSLIHLCVAKGKKTYYDQKTIIHTYTTNWCGLIMCAENLHTNSYFEIDVQADKSMNVVSSRDTLITYDLVEPNSRQILLLLTQLESTSAYNIQYSMKYKLYNNSMFSRQPPAIRHVPAISDNPDDLHASRHIV